MRKVANPQEVMSPTRMQLVRPSPACSAFVFLHLQYTHVAMLCVECQWCLQRILQDAVAGCCAGPSLCIPEACSSHDPEAEERGSRRLSDDISSFQDGLAAILSLA